MNQFIQAGLPSKVALPLSGLAKSTYYYKPNYRKGGKTPSTHTYKLNGTCITNEDLVKCIEVKLSEPFIDYGANRMALELKNEGFIVNKKKVYRLMKENKLLYPKVVRSNPDRQFVRFTVPESNFPFETIEIDIKYIFIQGESKTAYLITAIDTFTRIALTWELAYKMKAFQVAELVKGLIAMIDYQHQVKKYFIRTDNGPQFIAKKLQESLINLPFRHEFILPGTPQQNGHIESFHSTLTRLVVTKYEFDTLEHAKRILDQFYDVYNNKRIMTVLAGKSPKEFYRLWCQGKVEKIKKGKKTRFILREKPEVIPDSSLQDVFGVFQNYSQ